MTPPLKNPGYAPAFTSFYTSATMEILIDTSILRLSQPTFLVLQKFFGASFKRQRLLHQLYIKRAIRERSSQIAAFNLTSSVIVASGKCNKPIRLRESCIQQITLSLCRNLFREMSLRLVSPQHFGHCDDAYRCIYEYIPS